MIRERFDVSYLRSARGWFDTSTLRIPGRRALTLRDLLPPGRLGDLAVRGPGDRYLDLPRLLRGADIVHTQELGYWYSAQAARLKDRLSFKLVTTVWETIPFLGAYRNIRTRPYRRATLAATDLFLAATERAGTALLLEGAPPERIRVAPPGISTARFRPAGEEAGAARGTGAGEGAAVGGAVRPLILSPGRLVWEKGHQDVMRALAMLRKGLVDGEVFDPELWIVGQGPERARLECYARELGVEEAVAFRGFIPYEEMPATYARAACMVLASLPTWSWEEQFGMVLAEGMAAGVPILASSSGAIPEVTGDAAPHFSPGDWPTLARQLAKTLREPTPADVDTRRFSTEAAAERIAAAYQELLGGDHP